MTSHTPRRDGFIFAMNSLPVRAFFDELQKISSDLMAPAVPAESAVVDGPGATPFVKKKGYKKLEHVQVKEGSAPFDLIEACRRAGIDPEELIKEAGFGRDLMAYAIKKKRQAERNVVRPAVKGVVNLPKAVDTATTKAYVHAPEPLKKAYHGTLKAIGDPSDNMQTTALGNLFHGVRRMFGG